MVAIANPQADALAMVDVNEVAQLLGCSPRTVYRWVDGGEMPCPVKLGAGNRWPRLALERWLAARLRL
mgnify:CR=1 FL=1